MLLTLPYFAPFNALLTYGAQPIIQAVKSAAAAPEPVPDRPPLTPKASTFKTSLISVTCNQSMNQTMDLDTFANLLPPEEKSGASTSLRGIELINSATGSITGNNDGLRGSGLASVWLENHGVIRCNNGHGVKLNGDKADEVVNHGLIAGGNGVALDMGGGDDTLIIKHGSRFHGAVDGGSGTNQVILEDDKGGTFDGAKQMQHLWVATGTWTLTGAVEANQQGKIYSGATLINHSTIGGSMTVEPEATYSGGTVANLDVAGTLRMSPATRIDNDLRMQVGSTLAFTPGTDKTLSVGNSANLSGATLNIQMKNESDALLSEPVRIIEAKQIEGQFSDVTSNLKTLTPVLNYTQDGVFVSFKRNG